MEEFMTYRDLIRKLLLITLKQRGTTVTIKIDGEYYPIKDLSFGNTEDDIIDKDVPYLIVKEE